MSQFDPDQFLSQSVEGANDTKIVPCPIGEYTGIIKDFSARPWQSKSDPTKSGVTLEVKWSIDSAEVKALLDRDEVVVTQGIMLDLTSEGRIDMGKGKNIGLGRLREAVNLNDPTQPFAFSMLPGQVAKVNVTHREHEGNIYQEIKQVARLV